MTDEFDFELRQRLDRLAAAVIVDRSGLLVPVATSLRTGRVARRLASGLLVPAVLVALLVGLLGSGVGRRPTATPGASPATSASTSIANDPVTTTSVDGDFELTLRSAQAKYAAGEPLDVGASLTYHGPRDTVSICHDGGGPILFGVREKVLGGINLEPVSRLMFGRSTLTRDVPVTMPFAKSGGFSGDEPAAASFRAFFADPVFRLPVGTWHIYAVASSCSAAPLKFNLTAEVEVTVLERAMERVLPDPALCSPPPGQRCL
jgi:hypothetical protein